MTNDVLHIYRLADGSFVPAVLRVESIVCEIKPGMKELKYKIKLMLKLIT